MSDYKYVKANAFTSGDSLGNPAAFIDLGGDVLAEREMLEIAREHKGFVSEVVFVNTINGGIKLTYYSSECEVAFCGHGTIATMYSLIKDDPKLMAKGSFSIDTNKKGALTVYNKISSDDAIFISAPDAVFLRVGNPKKRNREMPGLSRTIYLQLISRGYDRRRPADANRSHRLHG